MTQVHIESVETFFADGQDVSILIRASWTHPVQEGQNVRERIDRPEADQYLDAPNQNAKDGILNALVRQIVARDRAILDERPPLPPPPPIPPDITSSVEDVDRDIDVP